MDEEDQLGARARPRAVFAGFDNPTYTSVPDVIFDELAPDSTEAELRVLLYIVRRTFGFKKTSDAISLTQMVAGIRTRDGRVLDRGTGLSRRGVMKGCAGLVERGIITVERRRSEWGDHETNIYRLRFKGDAAAGVGHAVPHGRAPAAPPVGHDLPPQHTARQHTGTQQTASSNETISNGKAAPAPGPVARRSDWQHRPSEPAALVLALITEFSTDFGDTGHTRANYSQAMRLLRTANLSEPAFARRMYEARSITRDEMHRRRVAGNGTPVHKAMPYFFAVLADLLGLRDRTAATRPPAAGEAEP